MKIKSAFIISTSLKSINAICRELFCYFIIKMVASNKSCIKQKKNGESRGAKLMTKFQLMIC